MGQLALRAVIGIPRLVAHAACNASAKYVARLGCVGAVAGGACPTIPPVVPWQVRSAHDIYLQPHRQAASSFAGRAHAGVKPGSRALGGGLLCMSLSLCLSPLPS